MFLGQCFSALLLWLDLVSFEGFCSVHVCISLENAWQNHSSVVDGWYGMAVSRQAGQRAACGASQLSHKAESDFPESCMKSEM